MQANRIRRRVKPPPYPFEDIREFLSRRPWLHGWGRRVSQDEYDGIMARELIPHPLRASYLRAFIDGWKAAKE